MWNRWLWTSEVWNLARFLRRLLFLCVKSYVSLTCVVPVSSIGHTYSIAVFLFLLSNLSNEGFFRIITQICTKISRKKTSDTKIDVWWVEEGDAYCAFIYCLNVLPVDNITFIIITDRRLPSIPLSEYQGVGMGRWLKWKDIPGPDQGINPQGPKQVFVWLNVLNKFSCDEALDPV